MSDTAALLARIEALEAVAGRATPTPMVAVDPGGFPGHVAAGELVESAWGNAVADSVGLLADRGVTSRVFKAANEGGMGTTEFAITGLSVVAPAAAGRMLQASYGLSVQATAQPGANAAINIRLRNGTVAGTVVAELTHYWIVGQPAGWYIHGVFPPLGPTPGATYVLCFSAAAGTYQINAGSWLTAVDTGQTGVL